MQIINNIVNNSAIITLKKYDYTTFYKEIVSLVIAIINLLCKSIIFHKLTLIKPVDNISV